MDDTATHAQTERTPQAEETFQQEIREMERSFLERNRVSLPPSLERYPPLPDPLPTPDEQINAGGWSYRCYVPGLYHAWPTDPLIRDSHLVPWMALFDRATGQMIQSLHDKAGPLITGVLFCVGRIGDGPSRLYLPDAITVPLWFSADPEDCEFVPIVSLSAPTPLTAFLIAMVRAHAMNGRLSEKEYRAMAGESPLPEIGVRRDHPPGRSQRIGALHTDGGVTVFLESGWVPAPHHPTFAVLPVMTEPASRWPAELKRKHLLGTCEPSAGDVTLGNEGGRQEKGP